MARTQKKSLPIYDGGVLLIADAESINFAGAGVMGSVDGNGNVTETISGGGGGGTPVFGEIVAGNINTFTLAHTPSGTISLAANGQVLTLTTDYTIVGAVITTVNPWSAGTVIADYQY